MNDQEIQGTTSGDKECSGALHCYVAPEFQVGDRVQHRASGKVAVITARLFSCVKHHPLALCGLKFDRSKCQLKPTGYYDISFDFDEDLEGVAGFLLEPASAT